MTAQTTTQRTAKHRLAVKERMARYETALRQIISLSLGDHSHLAEMVSKIASEAVSGPSDLLHPAEHLNRSVRGS